MNVYGAQIASFLNSNMAFRNRYRSLQEIMRLKHIIILQNKARNSSGFVFQQETYIIPRLQSFLVFLLNAWISDWCEHCADCTAGRVDQTSGGTVAI